MYRLHTLPYQPSTTSHLTQHPPPLLSVLYSSCICFSHRHFLSLSTCIVSIHSPASQHLNPSHSGSSISRLLSVIHPLFICPSYSLPYPLCIFSFHSFPYHLSILSHFTLYLYTLPFSILCPLCKHPSLPIHFFVLAVLTIFILFLTS